MLRKGIIHFISEIIRNIRHCCELGNFNTIMFYRQNVYQGDRNAPIKSNTILTLNSDGGIQNEWGSDLFFMPHHLTIDSQNNVWVTDVALHQVFKFPPYGGKGKTKTPVVRLGTKVGVNKFISISFCSTI